MSSFTIWILTAAAAAAALVSAGVALGVARPRQRGGEAPSTAAEGRGSSPRRFSHSTDLVSLLRQVVEAAAAELGAEAAAIAVVASDLIPIVSIGLENHEVLWLESLLRAENDSVIVTRYLYDTATEVPTRFVTIIVAPLRSPTDLVFGNLATLLRRDAGQRSAEHVEALQRVAADAARALESTVVGRETTAQTEDSDADSPASVKVKYFLT